MASKINREDLQDSIGFVARNFDADAYNPERARRLLAIRGRRRYAVAASIAGGILIAAAAVATFRLHNDSPATPQPTPDVKTETPATPAPEKKSARIEFNDAPVSEVAAEIEKVYGVAVSNLPADDPHVTLSYEGTAEELTATLNSLLGCDLQIDDTVTYNTKATTDRQQIK